MPLYYCKPTEVVISVHTDEQTYLDPIITYGVGAYLVIDERGPAAQQNFYTDPSNPEIRIPLNYIYPTITPTMHEKSVKYECNRRILLEVSESAQRNIATYMTQLQQKQINNVVLTPTEESDLNTANAIWLWIGAAERPPTSMLGTSDDLIATSDMEWYLDVKWPPWNTAWDAFVARF